LATLAASPKTAAPISLVFTFSRNGPTTAALTVKDIESAAFGLRIQKASQSVSSIIW
jgi:hypothetical protein